MPNDAFTHFVFVDFENVPGVDLGLMEGKPVHVSLLIGKNQKKLDLALVQQIHRLASQVELVEVGASGHNALDLTLAYYLGRAVERGPTALFHIVSKDKDFEPMIGHLLVEGIKVARCDAIAALPFLAPTVRATVAPFPRQARAAAPARSAAPTKPGAQTKPLPADRHLKIIERLWNPANRNRPASLDALLKYLKTSLGKKSPETEVQDLLRELKQQGVLTIAADGKVVYASAE
jgi:hypothetical protein